MRTFPFASDLRPAISNPSQPERRFTLCCRLFALGLTFTGAIFAQGISIVTASLPQGAVGSLYQTGLSVTGGTAPYRWTASGSVPPGLTVFPSGIITGVPNAAGNYNFVLAVTDANQLSASRSFSIAITGPVFSITTTSPLPNATVGQTYSQTLNATGGTPPYQWTASSGFPPGLSLDPNSGAITGTPSTAGSYSFTVQVVDSAKNATTANLALSVSAPALTITTISPLFSGTLGTAYNQTLSASGGKLPYQWSIASGSTDGLTLDPNSGVIQGTPQKTGTFTFVVEVSDNAGNSATQQFSLVVNAPTLTLIGSGSLLSGSVGVSYSQKLPLTVTGGTAPYTWSIPPSVPGLTFDPINVVLSGIPTAPGTFSLPVTVTDSAGITASKSLSVTIAPAALSIATSRQLPDGALNSPYSQALSASGGSPPFTWSANGLPGGLSINGATGVISGTPTAAGSFGIAITVSDSALAHYADRFTMNIALPAAPSATITGLSGTVLPASQIALQIATGSAYPADISGQAIISFTPNSGPGDGTIQFSSGGTTAAFTISAGNLTAPPLLVQTGTAAGTIVVSLRFSAGGIDITPNPAPSATAQIAAGAPVIKGVQVTRSSNAIILAVTGYSTALEVTQASFTFSAVSGQSLQSTASSIVVDVTSLFGTWFQSSNSSQFGSQFVFTEPFNIAGDPNAVIAGTVTLTNRLGSAVFTVNQ